MKILVIGGGGREHALAWKLHQSPKAQRIYVAPGNAGTTQIAQNVPIPASDSEQLLQFALAERIDLTVVGPDDALAGGSASHIVFLEAIALKVNAGQSLLRLPSRAIHQG